MKHEDLEGPLSVYNEVIQPSTCGAHMKKILAAVGLASAFSASAAPLLSDNVLSQITVGANTFFVTDTKEMERNHIIGLTVQAAKTQEDLDALVTHGVPDEVINGLKLQMIISTLTQKKQEEFHALLNRVHELEKKRALDRRFAILGGLVGLTCLFLGLFALSYFDRKKMRNSQKVA